MRWVIALLCVSAWAQTVAIPGPGMPASTVAGNTWTTTPVQDVAATVVSTGTTLTATVSAPASGNLMVFSCVNNSSGNGIASFASGGANVTTDGNGWRKADSSNVNRSADIWYAIAGGAGTQVQANTSGSIALNYACNFSEWHSSGTVTSASTLEFHGINNGTGITTTTATISPTHGDVCIGNGRLGNAPGGPSQGYTALQTGNSQLLHAYKVPVSASTFTSWTGASGTWDAVIVCFSPL